MAKAQMHGDEKRAPGRSEATYITMAVIVGWAKGVSWAVFLIGLVLLSIRLGIFPQDLNAHTVLVLVLLLPGFVACYVAGRQAERTSRLSGRFASSVLAFALAIALFSFQYQLERCVAYPWLIGRLIEAQAPECGIAALAGYFKEFQFFVNSLLATVVFFAGVGMGRDARAAADNRWRTHLVQWRRA